MLTGALASVYATFGRGRDAVLLLERYLEKKPEDIDAALAYAAWRMEEREEPLVVA